jgi:hypothetical protein
MVDDLMISYTAASADGHLVRNQNPECLNLFGLLRFGPIFCGSERIASARRSLRRRPDVVDFVGAPGLLRNTLLVRHEMFVFSNDEHLDVRKITYSVSANLLPCYEIRTKRPRFRQPLAFSCMVRGQSASGIRRGPTDSQFRQ